MTQLIKLSENRTEIVANIVLVHGLGGGAYETWEKSKESDTFWPNWLTEELDGIAVYSLHYAFPATNWLGTTMHLQDRATNVLACLKHEDDLGNRPTVYICHSLGGLIMKRVLREAVETQVHDKKSLLILQAVKGMIFVATPHSGSMHADLADYLRILIWPSRATNSLIKNDPGLRELNRWYRNWSQSIRHLVFFETTSTLAGTIVDPGSADPGLRDVVAIPIDGNHIKICKPENRADLFYKSVRSFIIETLGLKACPGRIVGRDFDINERVRISRQNSVNILPALLRISIICGLILAIFFYLTSNIGSHRALAEEVAKERGVPADALASIAQQLGKAKLPEVTIPEVLRQKASDLAALREDWGKKDPVSSLDVVKQHALSRLLIGDLDGAKEVLTKAKTRLQASVANSNSSVASLVDCRAEINKLVFNYSAASSDLNEAFVLSSAQPKIAFQYVMKRIDVLIKYGTDLGNERALIEATIVADQAFGIAPLDIADYISARRVRAVAFRYIGERESGTVSLQKSVDDLRQIISMRPKEQNLVEWATVHLSLAITLTKIAQRTRDGKIYRDALRAVDEALVSIDERTDSDKWTQSRFQKAVILFGIGELEEANEKLHEAAEIVEDLQSSNPRAGNPLAWAAGAFQLGSIYLLIGEREASQEYIAKAIDLFIEVRKEWGRTMFPLYWANTQNSLANAHALFGIMTSDPSKLKTSIGLYEQVEQIWTRDKMPRDWVAAKINLGSTYVALGDMTKNALYYTSAISAFSDALHVSSSSGEEHELSIAKSALEETKIKQEQALR